MSSAPNQEASLSALLKERFGFSAFRPLQEEIVRDALAGRDVVALLPTGGGKSLCFQLPALVRGGLTVVVSPLIALMKDQVDALDATGVPATFLNSSLTGAEANARMKGLREGRYRLLYVAPERLVMPSFVAALQALDVRAFAVDEAHCISAWGHDFRPEYRRLSELRDTFPDASIMALSATATPRVRDDIATSLRLRDPRVYVASFNRPNLLYRVEAKEEPKGQLLAFIGARREDSGIVYAQSRASVERIAEALREAGIDAGAYHAGLEGDERARVHEAFSRDKLRVVVATVAFGMGINKPNVRFVVHHDLPKDIESYYQETGRAGRDGLPSECLLLFQAGDALKQARFLDEKTDLEERGRARKKLEDMVHFAELATCRRAALLGYFGEADGPEAQGACGACDNCLAPREAYDGTILAQKLLSCVLRIRQKSGLSVGMAHVARVLVGSKAEKIEQLGHHELSTFGIGKELERGEWQAVGRELARLGLLAQTGERFPVVEVTAKGREVLTKRSRVELTRAMATPKTASGPAALPCDEALLAALRTLRKLLADERDVPAYVIFSDVSLRQMAREYPTDAGAFRRINGVGDKKLADLGSMFMRAIAEHIEARGKLSFGQPASAPSRSLNETARESARLYRGGLDVKAVAEKRKLAESTVWTHLATALEGGDEVDLDRLLPGDARARIDAVFDEIGEENLTGALERLGAGFDYGVLRLARIARRRR